MRVLFFGTYDERTHPRVRVLREGLSAALTDTAVCNVPLAFDTAERVKLAAQPWRLPAFCARLLAAWIRLVWASRQHRRPDVVVVGYLGAFDIHLARLRYPRATIVLDEMVTLGDTVADRGLEGSSGRLPRLLRWIDRRAEVAADLLVVDTAAQGRELDGRRPHVVVRVGAPEDWFVAPQADAPLPSEPVRVVFYGLYTPLQGAPVIGKALAQVPDGTPLAVTMIGNGQERDRAQSAAAGSAVPIDWLDWVDADDLPSVVAAHHVCLGIFANNDKAGRVVPNKLFQGAAAGAALVTSDTATQRDMIGDAAVYVPAGDPEALAEVLEGLATDRRALDQARSASRRWAEEACSPQTVVGDLLRELERVLEGV